MSCLLSTFATVVVLAALIFGPAKCQQCSQYVCPGGGCLNQSTICNTVNDCVNGSGFSFDEDRCTGKASYLFHFSVSTMHLCTLSRSVIPTQLAMHHPRSFVVAH